jgi:hypothetical protein|nr:MAG TPA: hypothetical protein [Caudoviricetes sp.]
MKLASKKKSLNINYRPLQASISMQVVTSVPDRQFYSAMDKSFTPDYTLTPLTLFPRCAAVDADSMSAPKAINSELTNMKWYERIGGVQNLISSGTDYVITQTGDNKGQIQVKKNSSIANPITLEFSAEYVDARTNQVLKYTASKVIIVSDSSSPQPVLTLDSPDTVQWYPVRDVLNQTITAKLMAGNKDITEDERVKFWWYRVLSTGALEEIVDGNGDNDWEIVSVNKNVLVVNRDFIGDEQTYVCKAAYRETGSLPSSPDLFDQSATTRIVRYIPRIECDFKGIVTGCPAGTSYIYPQGYVRDSKGVISSPEEWFKFIWLVKKPGASDYSKAGEGVSPTIPFTEGMLLDLQIEDRGAQAILADDADGSVLQDADGNILFDRINN